MDKAKSSQGGEWFVRRFDIPHAEHIRKASVLDVHKTKLEGAGGGTPTGD